MKSVFEHEEKFIQAQHLSFLNWNFIFLNTQINGIAEGYLSKSELAFLKDKVSDSDKKIAIVMHYHPAPVGTPLVDEYILKNRNDFWEIVTGTKVELIICGHVHGDYQFKYNNITIESGPATCFQWQKGTESLMMDFKVGYKVYYFDQVGSKSISKMW